MNYVIVIKYAVIFFPFIAFLFTMPFILSQYHKYGSISFFKSTIIYLFIFYFICAYFLVILPLPKISEVATLTTPRTQLIPFQFIVDFIENTSLVLTNPNTYLKALKESYFYIPIFNIFLTLPFGVFLRYFFKCDLWKTVIYTFSLSLFFELTQLSGLYFLYPRGYRLFDVDDLILNTLGGICGYLIFNPFKRLIPKIDDINEKTREKGKVISGFRRTLASGLDLFILITIEIFVTIIFRPSTNISISIIIIYYFVVPLLLNTSTIAEKFLNIKTLDYNDKTNYTRLILRKILFILIYLVVPYVTFKIVLSFGTSALRELLGLFIIGITFIIYFVSFIKYLFTNKNMWYEKISKTKLVSTIK